VSPLLPGTDRAGHRNSSRERVRGTDAFDLQIEMDLLLLR
jgi:hypothetical protein